MNKILVVEDSEMVMKVLRHLLQAKPAYQVVYANSFEQVKQACDEHKDGFFAALTDLNLPDALDGEVVDFILSKKIPTIVLTGSYDEKKREQLFSKGIVDYLTKEGRYAYSKAIDMIQRLEKNQSIKVLVVDDSDMSRKHVVNLFKRHLYQVLQAEDGVDAIKVMLENSDVKLLITDYNMPRMDGFELVKNLRYKYDKTDLIMIGVSGESNEALSAKFIKHGANDFLHKPFHPEEFYCRINHNIEFLELVEKIAFNATHDHLTGLYHRAHFFNLGREQHKNARANSSQIAVAVIDIDAFGRVNTEQGNEYGDYVLKLVAEQLQSMLSRFLLARADTDIFYLMMPGLDNEKALAFISKVKQLFSGENFTVNNTNYHFSFSAGVTNQLYSSLDEQISRANLLLQRAKEAGGNMVIGDDDED
ncbi:MAG: response regulator [Cellvibrio sp.]|nr:response regulator [Cellvibrio sp.]